jgi:hypothetical protein
LSQALRLRLALAPPPLQLAMVVLDQRARALPRVSRSAFVSFFVAIFQQLLDSRRRCRDVSHIEQWADDLATRDEVFRQAGTRSPPSRRGAPYSQSGSGTEMEPSGSWKFSIAAIIVRAVIAVPLSIATCSSLPSRRVRISSRRAW